jgi:hypothetical protein
MAAASQPQLIVRLRRCADHHNEFAQLRSDARRRQGITATVGVRGSIPRPRMRAMSGAVALPELSKPWAYVAMVRLIRASRG